MRWRGEEGWGLDMASVMSYRLSFDKPITDPVDRFKHGFARCSLEFFSEILDMRVDTTIYAGGSSVQIVEQLFAGESLSRVAGEQMQ